MTDDPHDQSLWWLDARAAVFAGQFAILAAQWQLHPSESQHLDLGTMQPSEALAVELTLSARLFVEPGSRRLAPDVSRFFAGVLAPLQTIEYDQARRQLLKTVAHIDEWNGEPGSSIALLGFFGLGEQGSALFRDLFGYLSKVSCDALLRSKAALLADLFRFPAEAGVHAAAHQNDHARELLRLQEGLTLDDLKAAYRLKAREWHPDRLDGMASELKEIANAKLADINQAYTALQEQLGRGEPSHTSAALPARAELVDRLKRYNQDSAPVVDESENQSFNDDREQSDDTDDIDEEDFDSLPYRPTSSGASGVVVFCIFVLLVGGALWWWHSSVSEQATHTAAEVANTPTISPPEHVAVHAATQVSDVPMAQTGEVTGGKDPAGVGAPEKDTSTRDAVLAEIDRFTRDMSSNDADLIAAHYAEHVDRYYLLKDLTRVDVHASLADWFARGNRTLTFDLQEPVVHFDTDTRASVHSVASSTVENAKGNTEINARSEIILNLIDGRWQVVSTRNFTDVQ